TRRSLDGAPDRSNSHRRSASKATWPPPQLRRHIRTRSPTTRKSDSSFFPGVNRDNAVLPGPVTDARAHELRRRYLDLFGGAEFPVPVESIAEDLLGLEVEEMELEVSGMLFPTERLIVVNGREPETRRRFTIAHELGHWVCQCLEGHREPL